jgi:cyclase
MRGNPRLALALIVCVAPLAAAAETPRITEVSPHLLIFSTSSGNVIASVGPDGALLVGTPSASSTASIAATLRSRTSSPLRYVVIAPEDLAHTQGDAGWTARGAFVAMQENALERLGGHVMGPPKPLPEQLLKLGVDRPRIAFSQVITFDMNGEAIHIVHQPPACTDAESLAHFHVANVLYFGEVFPGDGYPLIDAKQGGKLDGILSLLSAWSRGPWKIVPVRGDVRTAADLAKFRDMIAAVRNRIQQMIASGASEEQVQAAHPTTQFDPQWGHGRVTPAQFVTEVYDALKAH